MITATVRSDAFGVVRPKLWIASAFSMLMLPEEAQTQPITLRVEPIGHGGPWAEAVRDVLAWAQANDHLIINAIRQRAIATTLRECIVLVGYRSLPEAKRHEIVLEAGDLLLWAQYAGPVIRDPDKLPEGGRILWYLVRWNHADET